MKPAILACTGLDKPEGSVAREVALLGAEAGAEIVCPVLLNRSSARYKKVLAGRPLVVVDGCSTRCASKLAAGLELKVERKVLVSDAAKASEVALEPGLRPGPAALALARVIVEEILHTPEPVAPAEALAAFAQAPGASETPFSVPTEYLTVTHDKFVFRIPATGYLFNENDVWVQPGDGVTDGEAGGLARVGISDYMQQKLTDISFFEPYSAGKDVESFDALADLESAKAVFEVLSPVRGAVVAVNPAVVDNPGLINEDPYGAGWLVEVKMATWDEDRELLLDGPAYAESVKRKAAEE